MPKAWRLALIKSVLSAIPLHQLMVLSMDKKSIKKIEKIFRGFLWAGRVAANGGHCHVNWSRFCRPLRLGGLGIPNLGRTTISLWVVVEDAYRPLATLARARQIVGRVLYSGHSARPVRAHPEAPRKRHIVREALVERSWITDITGALSALALWQYVQVWIRLRSVQLSAEPDRLVWRWTTNGLYTSKSCYNALFEGWYQASGDSN
jgi:hypothetical protein